MERELKSPASKERKQGKERKAAVRGGGLTLRRFFTTPGVDPADEMAWCEPARQPRGVPIDQACSIFGAMPLNGARKKGFVAVPGPTGPTP